MWVYVQKKRLGKSKYYYIFFKISTHISTEPVWKSLKEFKLMSSTSSQLRRVWHLVAVGPVIFYKLLFFGVSNIMFCLIWSRVRFITFALLRKKRNLKNMRCQKLMCIKGVLIGLQTHAEMTPHLAAERRCHRKALYSSRSTRAVLHLHGDLYQPETVTLSTFVWRQWGCRGGGAQPIPSERLPLIWIKLCKTGPRARLLSIEMGSAISTETSVARVSLMAWTRHPIIMRSTIATIETPK